MTEPDVRVSVEIRRSPDVVRRWWTEFPPVYENAREQPHRIETLRRTDTTIETLTYWRAPFGREMRVPERFELREDGWDVHVTLPFGLAQTDEFRLSPSAAGTRVDIAVTMRARTPLGRLTRPAFLAYAKRSYPRTWRAAARWCEKATPETD